MLSVPLLTQATNKDERIICFGENEEEHYLLAEYADNARQEFNEFMEIGTGENLENNLFNAHADWQEVYNIVTPECMYEYKTAVLNEIQSYAQFYFFLYSGFNMNAIGYESFLEQATKNIVQIREELDTFFE